MAPSMAPGPDNGKPTSAYIGRFAPSPSGPLHFGSLVSAVGSWLRARSLHGQWLLRVEDIDPPREVPGATDQILRTLERFALHWDGEVLYQSTRLNAYREAVDGLLERALAFRCGCTRKDLPASGVYPGTCRNGLPPGRKPRTVRLRIARDSHATFRDQILGDRHQDLSSQVGDFVLWRADGMPAYQLAVVVDDAFQGVTEVVRGADLLDSTPRQIWLQRQLGLPTPAYCHLPLVLGPDGRKLSKRFGADPLCEDDPGAALAAALGVLGHSPPNGAAQADCAELLEWALANWDMRRVPTRRITLAEAL